MKYIESVLWRVAKRLSYIEDARCLKVNVLVQAVVNDSKLGFLLVLNKNLHLVFQTSQKTPLIYGLPNSLPLDTRRFCTGKHPLSLSTVRFFISPLSLFRSLIG